MQSRVESVAGYLGFELLGSVVRFPVWWYGSGLLGMIDWAWQGLVFRWRSYAIALWFRNLFVPMYGQYDLTGRLVSVFMRLIMIIGRCFAVVIEALIYVLVLCFWLVAPIFFVTMLLFSLMQGSFVSRVAAFVP